MSQRIWLFSDIHLELSRGWDLPTNRPEFDVLVVAGDLVPKMERGVAWLRKRVTDKPVIYIAGNHEFYGADIDRTVEKARLAAEGSNILVLQDDVVNLDGVTYVGSTLWTDFSLFGNPDFAMNLAGDRMNDYRRIRKNRYEMRLRPLDTLRRHLESSRLIKNAVRNANGEKIVVVSHHPCVRQAIKAGEENDALSAAYTSHRPDLLEHVDLWLYGHTHESRDFMVGDTRVVSNAKGYGHPVSDNRQFNPGLVIEL